MMREDDLIDELKFRRRRFLENRWVERWAAWPSEYVSLAIEEFDKHGHAEPVDYVRLPHQPLVARRELDVDEW
jgi:hypothetical protein